jgi:hypothetical protein
VLPSDSSIGFKRSNPEILDNLMAPPGTELSKLVISKHHREAATSGSSWLILLTSDDKCFRAGRLVCPHQAEYWLRPASDRHRLVLTFHHVPYHMRSLPIFLKELDLLYATLFTTFLTP